jgi:hypothetical protein
MAVEGRIECTNYATTCHRLATTQIDGRPFCPPCATAAGQPVRGYVRSRYNERPVDVARLNARLIISPPGRRDLG